LGIADHEFWASAAERHGLALPLEFASQGEAVMVDKPSRTYNSDDLAMLSRVLEEARDATVNGADLSELEMQELSTQLGKVIMDCFITGETDPERLKAIAVESFQQR
jgi:hypothetical protein